MKVSIIVPVYNVYPYLDKCLNSLVNQTLQEIEIIIVNDGSLDKSEEIILKYLTKYKNKIKYYKKENGGLSSARNYGLKYATAPFVAFLDSDDYVLENTYELLYNKAITDDFDITICNLNYVYPNKITPINAGLNKDLVTKEEIKKNLFFTYPAVWNKLYKKDLIKKIYFKENIWYEDVEFNFRIYPLVKKVGYLDNNLIQYVQRENSIMKKVDKRLFNYIENFNGLVFYYQKNNYYKKYYFELEYSYVRYLYATFIKQLSYTNDEELFKEGLKEATYNVLKTFPNYKKNPYLKKITFKNFYLKHFSPAFAYLLHFKNKRR